jgi:multicomponent Na+:H+ antiporter subunit D
VTGVHPGLVLIVSALAVAVLRGRPQKAARVLAPLLALVAWGLLRPGAWSGIEIVGFRLLSVRVDALSALFGLAMCGVTLLGAVYALHQRGTGEAVAALVYAAGALGVIFSADWLTLFACWELMAVASLLVIWSGGTARARAAGSRYLLVHASGGAVLLAGILVHASRGGSLAVGPLGPGSDPLAFALMLAGVALNAAVPPLHAWLTDAYPEASVGGAVFLSAFTTKTAVYVLIRVFPGTELLVVAGVAMSLYGVVYAVLENDIRRLLAYHIVSQVGYMVAGIGMGTPLALNGAAAHAYCHILYKALLFMGAGAVIHATGRRKLSELGGLGRSLRWVLLLYSVGAVSISGFPLFNGFISKSMVIAAAGEAQRAGAELLLTLASVGTFLHTGLKLPYFTFFDRDRGLQVARVPSNMVVAMALAAIACFGLGVAPDLLYVRLPYPASYEPYTASHVASTLQLLLGTAVGFWLLRAKLGGEATVSADTDWLYRGPGSRLVQATVRIARTTGQTGRATGAGLVARLASLARDPSRPLLRLLPGGATGSATPHAYDENARRLPIGATVFWLVVYFSVLALATGAWG